VILASSKKDCPHFEGAPGGLDAGKQDVRSWHFASFAAVQENFDAIGSAADINGLAAPGGIIIKSDCGPKPARNPAAQHVQV
jgi:hypothetical protein